MINVEKLKVEMAAAKGPGGATMVALQAVHTEAVALRMDGGGAAQPVVDKLISALDAVIGALQAPEQQPA